MRGQDGAAAGAIRAGWGVRGRRRRFTYYTPEDAQIRPRSRRSGAARL